MHCLHYHEVERPRGGYLLQPMVLAMTPDGVQARCDHRNRTVSLLDWPAQRAIWESYREPEALAMVVQSIDAMYTDWWREPLQPGEQLVGRIRIDLAHTSPGYGSADGWGYDSYHAPNKISAQFGQNRFAWSWTCVAQAIAERRQPAPAKPRQLALL